MRPWLELPARGLYVYRLLDVDDEVVYVGLSTQVRRRVKVHERDGRPVEWVTLEGPFRSPAAAEARERELIAELRPPGNLAGVTVGHFPDLRRPA